MAMLPSLSDNIHAPFIEKQTNTFQKLGPNGLGIAVDIAFGIESGLFERKQKARSCNERSCSERTNGRTKLLMTYSCKVVVLHLFFYKDQLNCFEAGMSITFSRYQLQMFLRCP